MRKMYGFTPTGKRRLRNVASTLCARCDIFQLPSSSLIGAFDLDSYILQYPMSLLADSEDPDQAVHPRSLPSGPSLSTYVWGHVFVWHGRCMVDSSNCLV